MQTSWRNIWKTTLFSIISLNIPRNLFSPHLHPRTLAHHLHLAAYLDSLCTSSGTPNSQTTISFPRRGWSDICSPFGDQCLLCTAMNDTTYRRYETSDAFGWEWAFTIYTELTLFIFPFIPPFCTYISTNIKCACLNLCWPAHTLTRMLQLCC